MSLDEDKELRDKEGDKEKDKESLELEVLTKKLSVRDRDLPLQTTGNSVYGYVNKKMTYLMSLDEYNRLNELRMNHKDHRRSSNPKNSTVKNYQEANKFFRVSHKED